MSGDNNFFHVKYGNFEAKAQGVLAIVILVIVVLAALAAKGAGLW